jgi:hypothetical protein
MKRIEKWGEGPRVLISIIHDFINNKNFEYTTQGRNSLGQACVLEAIPTHPPLP